MRKLVTLFAAVFAVFVASTSFAQTRTWLAAGTWEGFGTPNPINPNDFLYPYQVAFPNCFQILSQASGAAPWDPNGAGGVTHYVEATNGSTCAGGGAPNPGQGIYYRLNAPHRALGIVQWIRLNGNITTSTFINRFNDCTHAPTTGVFTGCIDYAAMQINTSNQLFSDITGAGTVSSALTLGTWYQYEHCYIAGTNGSGTVPSKESAWLNQTNFISNATPGTTTPNTGGGNGVTINYELGGGGTMDFGPYAIYDSGTACPASALATMYAVAIQPTSNGTVQFTPNANTNWQNAAAQTPGALSYNSDATAGQADIYNLSVGTFSNILLITQRASVEKTAMGTRIVELGFRISGTTYQCNFGNGFSLGLDTLGLYMAAALQSGTYQQIACVAATDPSTSSAWSGAGNAAHITATLVK